jgi:hypothetical protein
VNIHARRENLPTVEEGCVIIPDEIIRDESVLLVVVVWYMSLKEERARWREEGRGLHDKTRIGFAIFLGWLRGEELVCSTNVKVETRKWGARV